MEFSILSMQNFEQKIDKHQEFENKTWFTLSFFFDTWNNKNDLFLRLFHKNQNFSLFEKDRKF